MRLFLDEGVPDSVGRAFSDCGHEVIYLRDAIARGSPDALVAAAAEANDAILVAFDGDMKQIARKHSVGSKRFGRLSLIKFTCRESRASDRLREAMSLIEHEWKFSEAKVARRMFVEISAATIKTNR